MKLSVALATFNEEENIGRVLSSVRQLADEIVIVDGTSTDKTVKIAEEYGAKVEVTDNPPIFHINKQKAIDKCTGDFILQLDADEEVPEELKKEILEITQKGSRFAAFWIKRRNFFLGHWLAKGGQYPDPVIRFFKKGKAYLPCKSVHEQMEVRGKTGFLKNDLIHHVYPNFSRYLVHSNRYTSLTAQELKDQKIKLTLPNHLNYFFVKPLKTFFNIYLRHKGFQDSFPGFVFAVFSAFHFPIAYIKFWEFKKR